ncbi:hypothetical protein BKA69DRAFT_104336 [Paraphysoderma sedebokerense]|nr:hypothetical protein BKA69DRAFT_104336 [Paraphysoderma sedebokerense]
MYSPIKSPRPLPQLPDIAFPSPLPASPSLLKPITFDKLPQADLDIKDQPLVATSLSASNPRSSSPVRGRPLPIPPAPIEKTDKVNAIKSESVPGNIHVASKSSSVSHNQPSLSSESSPASSIFQRSSSETFANVADILNSYSGPSYQPQLSNFNQKKPVEQSSTRRTRSESPARKSSQRRSTKPLVSNVSVGELIDQYGYIERSSNRTSEELKALMIELTKEAQKISVATTAGPSMGEAISPHLRCHEATMDVVSSYTNIISPNQASSPGKPPADFVPGNHSSRSPTNARESITSVKPEGNSLTQIEYDADVDDTEPGVRGRTVLKDTLRATKTKSKSRTRTIPNNMISEVPGSESSQGIIKSPSKLPNVLDSFVSQYSSMESPGENFDKSDVKFSDSTPTVAFTNITDPRVTSTTYAQTVTAATLTATTQTPPLTSKSNQAQNPGRVKFLETMLDSLKSELLKQQSHRKTLETKLSQLENETQTLTIAKVTLESTVSDLQQQLDISRSTQVESKQEIYPPQSSPQLSRVSTDNSTLKAQLLQLQSELNVMKQEKSQMEKTVQHNVRRINSSLDRLLEDKATLEKQYLELKTRYDDVCSDLTDRKNKMVNTNDEIDKLRHERDIEITKRKEQVLQERRKYEIEEKRVKDLQGNLNDREDEIKILKKQVDRKD